MEQYLIDTNVISDYFSSSFPNSGLLFMDSVLDNDPNLSFITQIELLCWKTNDVNTQYIKDFLADSNILGINQDVVNLCVKIRKEKRIKIPDAIIAATAISHGFLIITANEKDFKNIEGLRFINPYKL